MPEEPTRLALCAADSQTGEMRPLRLRNGRLLMKLAADPAAVDLKTQPHRPSVGDTKILLGVDSEKREKLDPLKVDATGVLEVEIVGGLERITSFTNHHARHESGGADEVRSWLLSGIVTTLSDPGVDTEVPTEKAVRDAIDQAEAWGMFWAFFMGAA